MLALSSRTGRSPQSIITGTNLPWMADEWQELKLYQILSPPIETRFDILVSRLTQWVALSAGATDLTMHDLIPQWGKHLTGDNTSPMAKMSPEELAAYTAAKRVQNLKLLNPPEDRTDVGA